MIKRIRSIDPFVLARILIMLQILALAISTAVSSVVEILIYLTFISFPRLRKEVFITLRQPMVIVTLAIWAMVGIGVLYSAAPLAEGLDTWGSWRKCLMLPLAAAVYKDPVWKTRFAYFFIGLMALAALLSFGSYLTSTAIYYKLPVGIVIYNHATQGMFFAAAAFASLVLLRFSTMRCTWIIWAAALIIISNLIMVNDGRSGYLALLVCATAFTFWATKGRLQFLFLTAVPAALLLMLVLSPVARQKIQLGMNNIKTYKNAEAYSSMGVRMVFWENTLTILKKMEHPIFGYGTNGFKIAYADIVEGRDGWRGEVSDDPHNQYLKILVEYGVVGLALFLAFILSFFRQKVDPPFYYLGIGILLAWSATSLFNGHFSTFHEGRFFFIWSGVMLS